MKYEIKDMIYEGKAKKVYTTSNDDIVLVQYKDDATAFNGVKRGSILGKGVVNNKMSNYLMKILETKGIPTHYEEQISDRETYVKKVQIVPVEVIVRNIAAGSLAKRLGLEEGTILKCTVLEYCYKDDELGDPMINDYHIKAIGIATPEEMSTIADMALKVNDILIGLLQDVGVTLVDFKLEFGRYKGKIVLADEISPDTCRFWDTATKKKLDKDRFRRDLGDVEDAYQEMSKRLMGE